MAVVDDKKVIFGMHKVGKIYPPKRQVLKDISLSFFLGLSGTTLAGTSATKPASNSLKFVIIDFRLVLWSRTEPE